MRSLMEARYGASSQWLPELQRDMTVLADIAEGHSVMRHSAQAARGRMAKYGIGGERPTENQNEAPRSVFGALRSLLT